MSPKSKQWFGIIHPAERVLLGFVAVCGLSFLKEIFLMPRSDELKPSAIDAGKVELLTDGNELSSSTFIWCRIATQFGHSTRNACTFGRIRTPPIGADFARYHQGFERIAHFARLLSRIITPVESVEVDMLRVHTPERRFTRQANIVGGRYCSP